MNSGADPQSGPQDSPPSGSAGGRSALEVEAGMAVGIGRPTKGADNKSRASDLGAAVRAGSANAKM